MEGMRDLLRRSLSRSLRELGAEDRFHAAWPLVCGSALAGKAEVLHLDAEGMLHVRVTDPEWRERFFEVRSQLRDDLCRIAGAPLGGIHFEQTPRSGRPAASFAKPSNSHRPASLGNRERTLSAGAWGTGRRSKNITGDKER